MVISLLTALTLTATAPVLSADEQARFKAYVLEGERQFSAAEYGAAIWNFKAADALRVTPEMAYNLAKAHEKIGEQPLSAYYYRLYLRRSPEATDALEVAGILGDLLSRMEADGRGLIEIEATAPGPILIEGQSWPEAPVAVFLPPGDYEVSLRSSGDARPKFTTKVSVFTGRIASLALEPVPPPLLDADGEEAAVASAASSEVGGPSQISARGALRASSIVLMCASAVALGVGTAFGAMSQSDATKLSDKSSLTIGEAQATARSAGSKGATANVFWAAGGAGLVAGGAIFAFTLPEPDQGSAGGGK